MDEKELIELSEEIIGSLTKLLLGESPGFLSNSVFKKLPTLYFFWKLSFEKP